MLIPSYRVPKRSKTRSTPSADFDSPWKEVHVEVQGQEERAFAKRMFIYYCRILDRHGREVVSPAVLADERSSWRPDHYEQHRWGCSLDFRYPIVKLGDWRARNSELAVSDNPFAVVVLAHLAAQDTKGDVQGRAEERRDLLRRAVTRRFGAVPSSLEARIASADPAVLTDLFDQVLVASTIDEI